MASVLNTSHLYEGTHGHGCAYTYSQRCDGRESVTMYTMRERGGSRGVPYVSTRACQSTERVTYVATDRRPSVLAPSALVAGGRGAERRHGALGRYTDPVSVSQGRCGCPTSVVKVVNPWFPGREVNVHQRRRSAKAQQAQHLSLHAVPEGRRRVVCPRTLRRAART